MIRSSAVRSLLEKVRRLPREERSEFAACFATLPGCAEVVSDEALIEAARARLPATDDRRLRRLIAASERGVLTPPQRKAYRTLARKAEQLDMLRLRALTELARRRAKPLRDVLADVLGGDADGT